MPAAAHAAVRKGLLLGNLPIGSDAGHHLVGSREDKEKESLQPCHNAEVQRQHRRNELNLCHPPEIEVDHSREVEEEEGDADEENCRKGNSDFSEHFLMFLIVSHICLPQRGDYKNTAKLLRNLQKIHFLY